MHDIKLIKTRVKITNQTVITLRNGTQVPTFLSMVRQLNKEIKNG